MPLFKKINNIIIILKEFKGIRTKVLALFYFSSFYLGFKKKNISRKVIIKTKARILGEKHCFIWKINKNYRMDYLVVSSLFEKKVFDFLFGFFSSTKNALFVDIGAYIGAYSVKIAKALKGNVKLFEPSPLNYERCRWNITHNNLDSIVECEQIAFSDKKGEIFLDVSTAGDKHEVSKRGENSIKVRSITMDDFFYNLYSFYDILVFKIDVEGHEYEVLKGADKILRDFKDKSIFIVEIFKKNKKRVLDLVEEHNLKNIRIQGNNYLITSDKLYKEKCLNLLLEKQ